MAFDRNEFALSHKGTRVYVEISPCSWIYQGYGLQVKLALYLNAPNAASVFTIDRSFEACGATSGDLRSAARALATDWLRVNGCGPLREAKARWEKVQADFKREAEEREAKLKKEIAKAKAEGFTHRLSAWVHPTHGDDEYVELWFKGAPGSADIARVLRNSVVKTDYSVTEL